MASDEPVAANATAGTARRRLSLGVALANGATLVLLVAGLLRVPASAPVSGVLAIPLALALFAGRRDAGVAARGWAIGANVLVGLACAALLLFATFVDTAAHAATALLFLPVMVLCGLNMRALLGP